MNNEQPENQNITEDAQRPIVERLVMRFSFLRVMFYRNFSPGQKYVFIDDADNPFKKNKLIVEIKAIKGKWINYKHVGSTIVDNESMERCYFNFCYVRYDA